MKYCAKCGAACEDGFVFCPACGTEIPKVVIPTSQEVCEKVEETNEAPKTECVCEVKEETPEVKEVVASETPEVKEVVASETPEVKEVVTEAKEETPAVKEAAPNVEPETDSQYEYYFKPMPADGKGKCFAGVSLAFGLISLLFFWIPGVNVVIFILSILGIIFGSVSLKHYRYGAAIAGKTLSIFALVFNIILVGLFVIAVVVSYSYFQGFTSAWSFYSNQATSLVDNVLDFIASILLVH